MSQPTLSLPLAVPGAPPTKREPLDWDWDTIRTEDDTPVESYFQDSQQRLLIEALRSSWSGPPGGQSPR